MLLAEDGGAVAKEAQRAHETADPVRAPKANAFAERFVRTAECLDWLLIISRRHLERVLRVFTDHYNMHRPHRSLDLKPPDPSARSSAFRVMAQQRPTSSAETDWADSSTNTTAPHETDSARAPHPSAM